MTLFIISIFLFIVYVMVVIIVSRRIVIQFEGEADSYLKEIQHSYNALVKKKDELYRQQMLLEQETVKIFTLYEMTKEITKTSHEQEAFEVFKRKLSENVSFEECHLLDPLSEEVENFKEEDGFVFPLQEKHKRIGYIAVKGISDREQENVMILGHQFALALRRVKLYEEIEKVAITDSLTDVYTRKYLVDRLQEELRRSKIRNIKLSVLMIDVDFFKSFNDKYGHLVGDQILREIGTIIKANIREIDIAGRYGGEEFCVVLPDTDVPGAQLAAERIRKSTEETEIKAYDTTVKVTISIGMATFPADGHLMDELIDKADWALYRAKKLGRNKICAFGIYKN